MSFTKLFSVFDLISFDSFEQVLSDQMGEALNAQAHAEAQLEGARDDAREMVRS